MQMCMLSMMSLRKSGYDGPIALVTDLGTDVARDSAERLGQGPPPEVQLINLDRTSEPHIPQKAYKARLNRLTPFRRTLYLDCDTIVGRGIDQLWDEMASAAPPIAFALDRAPTLGGLRLCAPTWGIAGDWEETIALCGAESAHYNSGVIYWTSSPLSAEVFALWEQEIRKYCATDQAPLVRSLYLLNCKPRKLKPIYNVQSGQSSLYEAAVIRHFSGRKEGHAILEMWGLYLQLHGSPFDRHPRRIVTGSSRFSTITV